MTSGADYNSLITDIVHKQMDILGPEIAVRIANKVPGLKITNDGKVSSIQGDEQQVLQNLIDQYIGLSGQIVKNILEPVFAKYPEIKLKLP